MPVTIIQGKGDGLCTVEYAQRYYNEIESEDSHLYAVEGHHNFHTGAMNDAAAEEMIRAV